MTTIIYNLAQVQRRMALACARAGRDVASVSLLAVSKTFGFDAVREAAAAGQRAFGENYVQEALDKMAVLRDLPGLQWHCIGPLQSNKTRSVAEHFDWVHSVDRLKIAQRLSDQRPAQRAPLQVCLQINVDGGSTKAGVAPEQALALARAVAMLPRLCLRGLMSIPEPAIEYEAQYALHTKARAVFDQIKAAGTAGAPGLEQFDTLSLGMTADLDAAIAAGSTLVRVGTGIFGGR
ncbi:YggS family pyridoxal phosphate-dependent enzyme [Simplicispira psychrophila]|uniref:YggS family pyridoxal phosphate-dependent enzyme n=1 Tax=Simplicispira psychrophila TaxID=80882 RepID=UPI000484E2C0|nr:YggS family pyridoxal phosphate-dependent enzyme [Simplicispira psychrophila]